MRAVSILLMKGSFQVYHSQLKSLDDWPDIDSGIWKKNADQRYKLDSSLYCLDSYLELVELDYVTDDDNQEFI